MRSKGIFCMRRQNESSTLAEHKENRSPGHCYQANVPNEVCEENLEAVHIARMIGKYASYPMQNGSREDARTKVLMKGKHASEQMWNAIAGDVELNVLQRGKREFKWTLNVTN
ncbi:unnamed protein product [Heligmosomoides polygyrus]|uniref:SCP domain-containing protein n=1 Tax=Heligmosomoides polygyrus TaxID=6339 RepID=A0A183F408_HELPZ|nr:unnamed protein product [Heligmosomoides polygyrus]